MDRTDTQATELATALGMILPDHVVVPRALLERIVDANDRSEELDYMMAVPLGHWQDIVFWAEKELAHG